MSLLHSNSNCVISTLFLHHPQLSYSPTYHRQNCYDLIRYLSDHSGSTKATYSIHTSSIKTHRPSSFASFSNAQLRSLQFGKNEWVDWEEGEILGPNVESRETLLELAKMTNNAYLEPDETGWCSLNGTWNVVRLFHPSPFTWWIKHVQSSLILWMGTRQWWNSWSRLRYIWQLNSRRFDQRHFCRCIRWRWTYSEKKNKFNDNLLFSCCCARIDWTWTTVCGCYRGGWKCHQNCLEAHYWESVLPNWHCSYSRSLNLVDNNTHWCTDRIYAIIWPTCSKHSSTSWAVIITLISVFLALILISGLLDILYAGHWPANIISRISTAVQIVWRSQLTAFLVHGSLSSVDPLSDADFTLSKGSIPSCVSAQTRESIAYIGRAIAIVKGAKGQKQPSRDLAKEHTIMLEDVMPEDQHAFDLVISQIRTNVGEWLWLNVLTKKESVRCRRCYQRIVR